MRSLREPCSRTMVVCFETSLMYARCAPGLRTVDKTVSPVCRVRILLRCELCTTKNTPDPSHRQHTHIALRWGDHVLTAHYNAEYDTDHEVPYSHANHDASDRDVLHPGLWLSTNTSNDVGCTNQLTRCLVSHSASLTRSIPSTKMRAPTTMTAAKTMICQITSYALT